MIYFWLLGIARESEQRPEKLSLKKQLKLKCLEQNPNPSQNQVLVRYGVGSDVGQTMKVLNYSQQSKTFFLCINFLLHLMDIIKSSFSHKALHVYYTVSFVLELDYLIFKPLKSWCTFFLGIMMEIWDHYPNLNIAFFNLNLIMIMLF